MEQNKRLSKALAALLKTLRQFTSKDQTRPHLGLLAVDDNEVWATDGYRAIGVSLDYFGLERLKGISGLVDAETFVKQPDKSWLPQIKNLSKDRETPINVVIPKWMSRIRPTDKGAYVTINLDGQLNLTGGDVTLDMKLLAPIADGEPWKVGSKGPLDPVIFKREGVMVIIMPVRG